jgi:hypothetical protein
MVDVSFHCSPCAPSQVPRSERQTLPHWYRFGLKRTMPPPVVRKLTWGQMVYFIKPKIPI